MRPNLRALVAKAYRVRQGRTFSSSAPSPIADKGKGSVITVVSDTLDNVAPWFITGYMFKFGWEAWLLFKSKQKSDELWKVYERELDIYHEERLRSILGSSEE